MIKITHKGGDSMNLTEFNSITELVKKQLWSQEVLLNAHRTKKHKASGYVGILNTKYHYFMTLRFSDHSPRTSLFTNVSFIYSEQSSRKLKFSIQKQLRLNEWNAFTYRDFFTLKIIMNLERHKANIALDVNVQNKQQQLQKLSFYQIVTRKNNSLQRPLDKEIKDNLQYLFHTGVINYFENSSGLQIVYITPLGWALYHRTKNNYYPYWKQDVMKVDWHHLTIPDVVKRRETPTINPMTQDWKYRLAKHYFTLRIQINTYIKKFKQKCRSLFSFSKGTAKKKKKKKKKKKSKKKNTKPVIQKNQQKLHQEAIKNHWEKQVTDRTQIEIENLLGDNNLTQLEQLKQLLIEETSSD